ncbi:MAG: hypothetical protein QS748_12330 [Candidatus Endonucleobacter bathymodioli]|uniref:Uncharacterized protein n=1 Tax=Candidatus Endonucleibacter bathymodioli TaxID=539814 RepID=A0AA90P2I5_9GAMM|nr:hypothetical protein [Candidatus Endonucleobacter bathymodioli]
MMNNTSLNVKTEVNTPDHTTKKEIVSSRKFGCRMVSRFKKIAVKIVGWKNPVKYISKGIMKLAARVKNSVHANICYIIPLMTGIKSVSERTNSDDTGKRNNKTPTTVNHAETNGSMNVYVISGESDSTEVQRNNFYNFDQDSNNNDRY